MNETKIIPFHAFAYIGIVPEIRMDQSNSQTALSQTTLTMVTQNEEKNQSSRK